MATGVFSLKKVYKRQFQNVKDNNFASWPEQARYAYFGGGIITPVPVTRVSNTDRLDFATETRTTPTSKLSPARNGLAAVSSNLYGYFGGGYFPGNISTINRLDFSTESVTIPAPKLPQAKNNLTATSSRSYGYFGGGSTPANISTIDRLDLSTETTSVPTPKLSEAKYASGGGSNFSYGYFGGGDTGTRVSNIERLDFTTEVVAIPLIPAKLSLGVGFLSGTSGGQSV
jgi:hypothetical protein